MERARGTQCPSLAPRVLYYFVKQYGTYIYIMLVFVCYCAGINFKRSNQHYTDTLYLPAWTTIPTNPVVCENISTHQFKHTRLDNIYQYHVSCLTSWHVVRYCPGVNILNPGLVKRFYYTVILFSDAICLPYCNITMNKSIVESSKRAR